MARTKLYTLIYVVLFVFATAQVGVEYAGLLEPGESYMGVSLYWWGFGLIMVLSAIKAVGVAWYYQHLKWEPRAVSTLIVTGLFAAITLMVAAAYSIL
jgi:cytochrome c oxidase subunit 4